MGCLFVLFWLTFLLCQLPLASLATLITVHRNLPIAVEEEEKDKDGLKLKLDRFLQVRFFFL